MDEKTFEELLDENGFFVWKNVGISMMPLIREGKDLMVIKKRPDGQLKKYDAVLFKRHNVKGIGAYVLHRILKVNDDGTYWIVGDNCISGENVRDENIIGVLAAVVRNGKKIGADNILYRIYVYLWCAPYPLRFLVLKYISYLKRAVRKLLHILKRLYKGFIRHITHF